MYGTLSKAHMSAAACIPGCVWLLHCPGPNLTRGVEERESRIKDFGLRIKSAASRIAGGKQVGGA